MLGDKIHELPSKSGQTPSSIQSKKTKARDFENKGSFTCTFCSGKKCAFENWHNYPDSFIPGLSSHLITPHIIASQRPSNRLIEEYNLIDKFEEYVLFYYS